MLTKKQFFLTLSLIVVMVVPFVTTVSGNVDQTLRMADKLRNEQSFSLAVKQYEALLNQNGLAKDTQRELSFKYADCSWRTKDQRKYEDAVSALKDLIESDEHDQWWAEASESLAEHYLEVDRWQYQKQIEEYLNNAREYWAGSKDIEIARKRFIKATFSLGEFITSYYGWSYQNVRSVHKISHGEKNAQQSNQGLFVLYEDILKIAKSDEDKAKVYYSLGMSYMHQYQDQKKRDLAIVNFSKVIKETPYSEWVDDAIYYLAQYYAQKQDYKAALKQYEYLMFKFRRGQSQWVDDAQRQIKNITEPQISLNNSYAYLPGSQVQLSIGWKNVSVAKFDLYKINLVDQLVLDMTQSESDYDRGIGNYQQILERLVKSNNLNYLPKAISFKRRMKNDGKHMNHHANKSLSQWMEEDDSENVDFEKGVLAPGAYLMLVSANGKKAYDLVLVTETGLLTKTGGSSTLFYAFDSQTGKPKPEANVKYHYRYYDNSNNWKWLEGQGVTDSKGLFYAKLKINKNVNSNQHQLFAVVSDGEMQAFSQGNYYSYGGGEKWKLYSYSDRPAYRPNEEVSFKGILRSYDGSSFSTPSRKLVSTRIIDPRGNKIMEKSYTLNDFGSFNDKFVLDGKATLGEYRLEVYTPNFHNHIGNSVLFRLEEYKLPEFLVSIKPKAKEGDGPSTYQLGDTIDIEVDAQYYFGGAVADAEVEYLVYQQNYNHYYRSPKKYSWYYEDTYNPYGNYYGNGQLVTKEKITTDKEGKAFFSVETPQGLNYDLKYKVEVRVVDQSRREIVSTSEIKVTRFPYYAYLEPKQNLYRPADKVQVDVKTITANDEPVSVDGQVTVYRNWWKEAVVKEDAVVKQAAYDKTELFSKFVKTDKKGEAVFSFEPDQDGYYEVVYKGFDNRGEEIKSSTNVFVCEKQSKELGYRYGGIQIISEKDTYDVGDTARVMLVVDNPESWVLFSVEAEEIFEYSMNEFEGTVKLIEIPIVDHFTPNIFFNAISPINHQLRIATLGIVVPPEEKFLSVKITSEKEMYRPQDEGKFEIEVTDNNGNPVVGEISLGVVDASVYYIQSEIAPDIRQFFYGQKRYQSVQNQSSFSYRQYKHFVVDEKGQVLDQNMLNRQRKGQKNNIGFDEESKLGRVQYFASGAADMVMEEAVLEKEVVADGMVSSSESSPMKMMAKKSERRMESDKKDAFDLDSTGGAQGEGELKETTVRKDFRSTVVWQPTVTTDEQGKAVVKVKFPDSLTTWKATARSITRGTSVGNITYDTRTKKDVIIRLQAPRFFTERDEVVISANVHNYTDEELEVKVGIKTEGLIVEEGEPFWIKLEPQGERRIDWKAIANEQGMAKITVIAQSKEDSDAMVKSYPVIPHGIEKFVAESLVAKVESRDEITKVFDLNLPKERIEESTSLQINLSPSIAATLLDALSYLADYPYGCVEQTMSRFLPAVVVKKTMSDLGLSNREINAYLSDVLSPRNDPAYDKDKRVMTLSKLDQMTKAGIDRLYDFQHSDGGWGWWKKGDSDHFMTAYVVWGLSMAKEAGIKVKGNVIQRAVKFLREELVERENDPDMLAWMLHALGKARSNSAFEDKQISRLLNMRGKLNPYTRALFALSQHYRGDDANAQMLARNLVNGIIEEDQNGTAHWGESGIHYRWSEGGVEATSFVIKALVNIMPDSEYIEPAVKWLALNRRGSRWKNTRDTAIAILGLADYLKASNELTPDLEYKVSVNGKVIQEGHVGRMNLFIFNRIIHLNNDYLKNGKNKVEVVVSGEGSLYVSGYMKYFTLEEDITSEGNEVFVERKYFIEDAAETLLKGYDIDWKPLKSGDKVKSGDRVKVEITLDSKNHYEYIIVEDFKPAGLEAVELKSGYGHAEQLDHKDRVTNGRTWLYKEFRDKKAAMFIDKLKQGKHRISYELRAEVPGTFHAMPNQTHAMYVPEIRANSSEMILIVGDE